MAYVSRELKAKAVANLKQVFAGKNVKYSVSVQNHSTLRLTIRKGDVNFIGNFNNKILVDDRRDCGGRQVSFANGSLSVNHHWLDTQFDGEVLGLLEQVKEALLTDEFFDESDPQSDYFHRSHYIDIEIGTYDKPYVLVV